MSAKPNIVILGGLGFIGRNFVEYLVDNGLAGKIRVCDKGLPELVGLSEKQLKIFKDASLVDVKQVNLAREDRVAKAFDTTDFNIDFVVNLAAETKYSQTDEVYKENIIDVAVTCGKAAAKVGVKRFIEVSTSQIYNADKKASSEDDKTKPWTKMAEAKMKAEEELRKIPNLNLVVVRPAVVYGPGDVTGITPRIICAAVYKHLGEPMEYLWNEELKYNTVHVTDVCGALWHLMNNGANGEVYNLADSGDTDQGKISKILDRTFAIKSSFMGSIKSKLATSIAMKTVAETANEKHLKPWSDLCKSKGITNTPLTPYLDEELLYNNAYSVDGTKITKTGFSYKFSELTDASVKETIDYFIQLGYFPKGLL